MRKHRSSSPRPIGEFRRDADLKPRRLRSGGLAGVGRDLQAHLVGFRLCLERKLVRDVVLVDVAHVGRGLRSNPLADDQLYVVEPLVRIEAFFLGFRARLARLPAPQL